MRLVHLAIEHRIGRLFTKAMLKTRISGGKWDPVPLPPDDAAALIAPIPLLIVHGDKDELLSRRPRASGSTTRRTSPRNCGSCRASGTLSPGAGPQLIKRIGQWMRDAAGLGADAATTESAGGSPVMNDSAEGARTLSAG